MLGPLVTLEIPFQMRPCSTAPGNDDSTGSIESVGNSAPSTDAYRAA